MAAKKILFIEGKPGDLRQGFEKLLEKRVAGNMPRIILGESKSQTIRKFRRNSLETDALLLLIDLDKPEEEREKDLITNDLLHVDNVFYMIQEMEAWFISQPEKLDFYFGKKVSDKLAKRPPKEIADPKTELKRATKDSNCGKYDEIKHAVGLLKLLDPQKLETDFVDFKNLIDKLRE